MELITYKYILKIKYLFVIFMLSPFVLGEVATVFPDIYKL